jgi:hypothetical protein
MLWRLSHRAAPTLCLILSVLWTAGVYFPFFYSLTSPNHDIQHLVGALQGHETARQELSSYVQNTIDSSGQLKHVVRVAAYYGASAEYKLQRAHTSKETEYAYLAWFEKRSKPTILVINLSEIDGSRLRFNMREGEPLGLARVLMTPLLAFSLSLYWFRRKHTLGWEQAVSGQ